MKEKQVLKEAGANYIRNVGWYLYAATLPEVEADDSQAVFLGTNIQLAYERLQELDRNEKEWSF